MPGSSTCGCWCACGFEAVVMQCVCVRLHYRVQGVKVQTLQKMGDDQEFKFLCVSNNQIDHVFDDANFDMTTFSRPRETMCGRSV